MPIIWWCVKGTCIGRVWLEAWNNYDMHLFYREKTVGTFITPGGVFLITRGISSCEVSHKAVYIKNKLV
jgi:hypothetical protein